jgi:hypothetical protein
MELSKRLLSRQSKEVVIPIVSLNIKMSIQQPKLKESNSVIIKAQRQGIQRKRAESRVWQRIKKN